jgi:hypothetical protein
MTLTKQDYVKILNYYKLSVPKKTTTLKRKAERVLADKLCRCIKKVDPKNEGRAIGVCTRSVINKKGLTRGTFKCKKGTRRVNINKTQKRR